MNDLSSLSAALPKQSIPVAPVVYQVASINIYDKTEKIAEAIFNEGLAQKHNLPAVSIEINKKFLIHPITSNPSKGNFFLVGSSQITFEHEDEFIKIEEIDNTGTHTYYVDPNKEVNNVAYDVYNYKPKLISLEDTVNKVKALLKENPSFAPSYIAYNRHGIAAFGFHHKDYAFYWAHPEMEKMELTPTREASVYRDGGSCVVKSKNGFANFRYLAKGNQFYFNAEIANEIKKDQI